LRRTARSPGAYRATRLWLRTLSRLARHGHGLSSARSAREHVAAVQGHPVLSAVAPAFGAIAAAYERMRFGAPLPAPEAVKALEADVRAFEEQLATLRRELARGSQTRLAQGEAGMGHSTP